MLLNYSGKNMSVMYRYTCYLVPGAIDEAIRSRVSKRVEARENMMSDDVSESHVMRELLVGINRDIRSAPCHQYGGYEDGSSQVLSSMLVDWSIDTTHRSGRFNSDIFSEHQLIRMATHIDGGNPYGFSWRGKPRFRPMWERMRKSLRQFLFHNSAWTRALDWFLDQAAGEHANEYISVDVWDPYDTLTAINEVAFHGDHRLLPKMMAVVEAKEGFRHCIVGYVFWDGRTFPALRDVLLGRGRLRDLIFQHLLYDRMSPTVNHEILARHGMAYSAVPVKALSCGTECTCRMATDEDGSSAHPVSTVVENHRTLVEFCRDSRNAPYLSELHGHLGVIVEL